MAVMAKGRHKLKVTIHSNNKLIDPIRKHQESDVVEVDIISSRNLWRRPPDAVEYG